MYLMFWFVLHSVHETRIYSHFCYNVKLRSCETSLYRKLHKKNLAQHPNLYLHTGRWNRVITNTRMRNFALYKQRSPSHQTLYSQFALKNHAYCTALNSHNIYFYTTLLTTNAPCVFFSTAFIFPFSKLPSQLRPEVGVSRSISVPPYLPNIS
jgi:hypothetical protein